MPVISGGNLTLLRGPGHKASFYLSVLRPRTLLAALVNDSAIEQGEITIAFDNGVPGAYVAAIAQYQEVLVGTAAGLDDIGRVRLRSYLSLDGGVTGGIVVARNSIRWADNYHITIKHDYPLKPMYPFIGGDGTFYKDGDIAYSDQNKVIPQVTIGGPHRAGFLVEGECEFFIDMSPSYPIVPGGSIHLMDFDVVPGTGFTKDFNTATGIGSVTFTVAGQYWVRFFTEGLADGEVVSQSSYRCFFVHDPDPSSEDYPIHRFRVNGLSGDWDEGGWSCQVDLHDQATVAEIPDKTLAILWGKMSYGSEETGIGFLPGLGDAVGNDNTLLVGYVNKEKIDQNLRTGSGLVDFEIRTIDYLMRQHYMFSISLEARPSDPVTWYEYIAELTVGRAIHHLFSWHSTLLLMTDVYGLTDNTDGRAFAEMEDGNLYSLADTLARGRGIRAHLVSDRGGRLHLTQDVQLMTDAERSALIRVATITKADMSDKFTLIRDPLDRSPFVSVSGFSFDGTFDGEGKPNALAICAVAPGDNPGEEGASVFSLDRQVFRSQTHANQIAGRVLASTNNEYPEFRMMFHGNYLGVLEPAIPEFWRLSLNSIDTERGVVWVTKDLILRAVNAQVDVENGVIQTSAIFEPEADGPEGTSTDCPTYPDVGGDDPELPDETSYSGAIATASSVYYLPPVGDWVLRTAEATLDMGADPFWVTKKESVASLESILWRCGVGYIKRSDDGGQTWQSFSPGNPPNGTFATCEVIRYEGNFSVQDQHVFLVREEVAENAWNSWLLTTDNDGGAWSWHELFDDPPSLAPTGWGSRNELLTSGNGTQSLNMGNGIIITVYTTPILSGPGIGYIGYASVGGVSGNIISYGDPFSFYDGTGVPNWITDVHACALDNERFLVAWQDESAPTNKITVRVGRIINGDEIEYGDTAVIGAGTEQNFCRLVRMEDDKAILLTIYYDGVTSYKWTGQAVNLDGVDIDSVGIKHTLDSNVDNPIDTPTAGSIVALSDSKFIFCYSRAPLLTFSRMICCSVSGDSITPGTPVSLLPETLGYPCALSDSLFALVDTTGNVKVCSISGTTITVEESTDLLISHQVYGAVAISGTRLAMIAQDDLAVPVNFLIYFVSIDPGDYTTIVESVTATVNSPAASFVAMGYHYNALCKCGNSYIFTFSSAESGWGAGTIAYGDAAAGLKGLGLSVGKLGIYTYVTAHNGSHLVLLVIDMVDWSIFDEILLGEATAVEVDSKQRIAYPYTPPSYGDDGVFVYGRMSQPADLVDDLCHIIISLDAAETFELIEGGWGSDFCGSMVEGDDNLHAIRNTGNSASKLYSGSDSFTLRNALSFAAGVNPMALAYDWYNQILYAGGSRGTAVMVIRILYPFSGAWENITFSHGTGSGINSVVVL